MTLEEIEVRPEQVIQNPIKGYDSKWPVEDIIEYRKQSTRMIITIIGMGLFSFGGMYGIIGGSSELKIAAWTAIVGLVTGLVGYYFGSKKGE